MTDLAPPVGAKRSGTELALIGFGLVLTMLAFTSVSAAYSSKFPSGLLSDGLGFIALAGVAHLAVRRFAPYADPVLLPAAIMLNGLGLVLIHRLDLGRIYADMNRKADAKTQFELAIKGPLIDYNDPHYKAQAEAALKDL